MEEQEYERRKRGKVEKYAGFLLRSPALPMGIDDDARAVRSVREWIALVYDAAYNDGFSDCLDEVFEERKERRKTKNNIL